MELKALKSGTDIRGTAIGENYQLTDEVIRKLIFGFVRVMEGKTGLSASEMKISVGHDSRLSSVRMKKTVETSLSALGCRVMSCGLSSTPAMFMTTVKAACTGAVQITASHLPKDKNGLKFFTKDGGFEGSDIDEIIRIADSFDAYPYCSAGKIEKYNFMARYAEDLREMIRQGVGGDTPLEGFHIVVDAGNGVGGFYATEVLAPLGADITGSQFLNPDGDFPNHIPNPEDKTAMQFICDAVTKNNGDLGVIFDTDVDRAACVGSDGKEINRNRLVALASAIALEDCPGGTIVTDSVTSDGLKIFINETLGGHHHRFKRGYKNVINESIRLNSQGIVSPLAIETSGHAALKENYFLDDGAYLITKIIIKAAALRKDGKNISDLLASLPEPSEASEYRFKILPADFKSYGQSVIDGLENYANGREGWTIADDNREGIRISFDKNHGDGWLLLRLSVHDPILPLNIESNTKGGVNVILSQFREFIEKFEELDLSALK